MQQLQILWVYIGGVTDNIYFKDRKTENNAGNNIRPLYTPVLTSVVVQITFVTLEHKILAQLCFYLF